MALSIAVAARRVGAMGAVHLPAITARHSFLSQSTEPKGEAGEAKGTTSGEDAQQERPEPRRIASENTGSSSWGKFGAGAFVAVCAYGGFTYWRQQERIEEGDGKPPPRSSESVLDDIPIIGSVRRMWSSTYHYFADPPKPKLLTAIDVPPGALPPLTVLLNLDETLVFTEWDRTHGGRTRRRPFATEFLRAIARPGVEIVVFSSSSYFYTQGVVAALDPKGEFINNLLSKEHTVYREGKHIKDLSRLNRDLSRVVIIDNNPDSYHYHPENAISISKWRGDRADTSLRDLIPLLDHLASPTVRDVRAELRQFGDVDVHKVFKERADERQRKKERIGELFGTRGMLSQKATAKSIGSGGAAAAASDAANPPRPEAPQKEAGGLWKWLKRRNDQEMMREQQLQEEWMLRQEAQRKPNE